MANRKLAKNVFITGANRGLGLEFVRQLVPCVDHVFATCRQPDKAKELKDIAGQHSNLTVMKLVDVKDAHEISLCVQEVSEMVKESGLSCLINNAAVNIDKHITSVADLNEQHLSETFTVNCIAPIMLTKAFLPLLKKAAMNPQEEYKISKAVVVNISSILGTDTSIQKDSNRYYSYRMSKSALNNFTRGLAFEAEDSGIFAFAFHPGWVRTDMGGEMAPVGSEESIDGMINILSSLKDDYKGRCVTWQGQILDF